MDNDVDEVEGGRVPMVRKHYTAFNGLLNSIRRTKYVHGRAHPGQQRLLLQPHMSHAR